MDAFTWSINHDIVIFGQQILRTDISHYRPKTTKESVDAIMVLLRILKIVFICYVIHDANP